MLNRAELERLIASGASLRGIAEHFAVDRSTVRRALAQEGLSTDRQRVLTDAGQARLTGADELLRRCPKHGEVLHRPDARGTYRCPRCNAAQVARHRRRVKQQLIADAGGACQLCGYDRCGRALSFHHVDPSSKAFGLAIGGVARSIEKARSEAAKCVLLCANCHMEVEDGMQAISLEWAPRSGVAQRQSS